MLTFTKKSIRFAHFKRFFYAGLLWMMQYELAIADATQRSRAARNALKQDITRMAAYVRWLELQYE
jgi:hypothetical protein